MSEIITNNAGTVQPSQPPTPTIKRHSQIRHHSPDPLREFPMASTRHLFSLVSAFIALFAAAVSPSGNPHSAASRPELLAPILANLGYNHLAVTAPSLNSPILTAWSGPVTLFAPSDDSVHSCAPPACSPLRLLREHLAPGLFSLASLSRLPFGAKIATAAPGRCLTITSAPGSVTNASAPDRIFVDGAEITHPDIFNDGHVAIHGLTHSVAPLSPLSCLPHGPTEPALPPGTAAAAGARKNIVGLMVRDAIARLRDGGYRVLAQVMRASEADLAGLQNMTVFALDDPSVFAGGQGYVSEVRFHVVPDRRLLHSDLVRLREGTVLPTLASGQHLVVTHSGEAADGWPLGSGVRINYVQIKAPDVVCNTRVAVHGIFLPFPHLHLADLAARGMEGSRLAADGGATCDASGCCSAAGTEDPATLHLTDDDDDDDL